MRDHRPKYCSLLRSHYFQQYLSASYQSQTHYFRRYSTISTAHALNSSRTSRGIGCNWCTELARLEKRNGDENTIFALTDENGDLQEGTENVMNIVYNFYEDLYKEEVEDEDIRINFLVTQTRKYQVQIKRNQIKD